MAKRIDCSGEGNLVWLIGPLALAERQVVGRGNRNRGLMRRSGRGGKRTRLIGASCCKGEGDLQG